jgi:hypothetical protein
MKTLLRFLKLSVAFFLLFFGLYLAWFIYQKYDTANDRAILTMPACLAIGATILWMEWKKN